MRRRRHLATSDQGGQANVRPTANFSTDVATGSAPLVVQFDASASVDPDGDITSLLLELRRRLHRKRPDVSATPTTRPGPFAPRLTVTDDRGASHTRVGEPGSGQQPAREPGLERPFGRHCLSRRQRRTATRDAGEDPIPNLIVFLDEDDDGVPGTRCENSLAVTDDDGASTPSGGLDGGRSYTVTQALASGMDQYQSREAPTGSRALPSPVERPGPWTSLSASGAAGGVSGGAGRRGRRIRRRHDRHTKRSPPRSTPREWRSSAARRPGPGEFPFQIALVTVQHPIPVLRRHVHRP